MAASPHVCLERLEKRDLLAVLYWDPDLVASNNVVATGAGLGGSGIWREGGAAVWFDPSLGGGAGGYVNWNSSRGDTAVFAGVTGGTVTLAGSLAAVAVEFRGAGYVVSGGSFNTAAAGTTFTATAAARFDVPIAGTGAITKSGAATITLGAAVHSYTGDTRLAAGLLDVRGTIQSHVRPMGGSVQGVMFYDPDLAAAVREGLGVDPNAWLTPTLVAQSPPITSLVVDGNVVGDLTGITSLPALTSLELLPADSTAVPQGLATLAPLAGLTRLTGLSLQHVGLTDAVLATLPSLPSLARLDVRSNALSAVPWAVAGQPRLGTLFVHGNPLLAGSPRTGLMALKGKAIDIDVAPDRPEMAADVADLAARLYFLPLEMLEYVTNTVVFQPYTGAMKGPLATLQTRAGNDWDTNSLLASLYAAAGVPTRYVAGAIELTEGQLREFVGARDTRAAATILGAAGLGYDQYANHLKHAWLEALVTVPERGVQAWVPIDASWKVRDFRPGLPAMLTNVPFSPLESDYLTNPAWQRKSTAEYYEAKVAAWLAQNRPDLTIADVGYDGPIRQQSFPAFPASLPYAVVSQPAETARPGAIPAAANSMVTIKLANDAAQLFGANGVTFTLADIALSRLTIDPGLDGRPTLRRDGVAIATAPAPVANPSVTKLALTITITAPAGGTGYTRTFTRAADRFIAIGLDANQFSEATLVAKRAIATAQQLNQANGVPIDRDQAVGGLLDLAIASYFTAADADEASLASLTSAVADRTVVALGIATSASALSATATAGLQFPYLPADMGIDVPANVSGGIAIDASTPAVDLGRNLLMGYTNSSLEGLTLEELTNFESGSTMKAFQLVAASAGGLSNLVEINAGNVASIATLLPGVRSEIRDAIASAVRSGLPGVADFAGVTFRVLVPKTEIAVGAGDDATKQWKGVGYTLTCVTSDPAKVSLDGKTVGFIIHGAVGANPLVSYGGATSRIVLPPPVPRPTVPYSSPANLQGDPVNVANGNVYHEETDVEIPNLGVPLALRRRYDSINTVAGIAGGPAAWSDRGMGEGWSFSFSDRLEIGVDGVATVTWFTDTGMRLVFNGVSGGYANPAGVFGTLTGTAGSGFTWKDFDGNTTTFGVALGGMCPIVTKSDRFNNGVSIGYVAGTNRIARVSDLRDASRWLSFTYSADARPRVTAVADFTGRIWTFTYSTDGRLQSAASPPPASGTAAPVVRYAYHADAARRGLLASLTDPGGFTTSWEYYANRRGFRVTDAEGLRHSFSYNLHRRQSVFVNERGLASRYAYDDAGNLSEVRQPDRTSERSTWSSTGLKISSIDSYGATTAFAYDGATGKVTRVTDPLGNVTTYEYTVGAFRDVAAITRLNRPNDASDDVTTRFVYDATGFLASRTDDAGLGRLNAVTRFTAAPGGRGLVGATTSPRGVVTTFTFNSAGQVLTRSVEASPGVTVTESFAYDARGGLLAKTDGNGNVTTFSYDTLGRKTTERSPDPDGAGPLPAMTMAFAYDALGNLVSTTRGDGRVVRVAYDRRQREVKRTAADGTFTLVSYDPSGNKSTETDALGRVTRFTYDARGQSVATLLPDGTTTRRRVDGGGRVVAMIDQSGATTTTVYDRLGRTVLQTLPDPDGSGPLVAPATATGYDSRGNVLFVTAFVAGRSGVNPGDPAWSSHYEYDALGRKTKETQADPDGSGSLGRPVTSFAYDADGNLAAVTDPRGFTTTFVYDGLGRKTTETSADPDGTGPLGPLVRRFVYDNAGNLRFEVAPGGAGETDVSFTTEHVYDTLGREIRTILPDPDGAAGPLARPTSTRTYDARGFLASTTDPLGRTTRSVFDRVGRVVSVTNAAGVADATVFDAVGNAVITIDPLGRRWFSVYDAMNRKVAVRGPRPDASSQAPVTRFDYDVVGNLVATVDPLGRTTWQRFDAIGRVIARTDALGIGSGDPLHTTRMEYDAAGRLTAVTDELGRRTDTVYDGLGRKIRTLAPDAGQGRPTTSYGYDASGNLRFTTDPRGSSAGDAGYTTWFFYDALGRPVATVDPLGPDWPITAVPDALPASVTTNVVRNSYDARGRLVSTTDAVGRTTDSIFDNLGRKIAVTAPAPAVVVSRPVTRFAYDAVGNLAAVTDPLGFVTTYGYDQLDRRTTVRDARGFSTVTTYDVAGNTTSLTDAAGNVTRYAYDRQNRLVVEIDPLGKATTYAYDAVGNKIRETDRLGRVTSFVFDAADRVVEERWQQSTAAPVTHVIRKFYDAADQLLGVTEADAMMPGAATAWQFAYDAGGKIVRSRMAPGELAQAPSVSGSPSPPGSLAAGDATIDWDGDGRPERYDAYVIALAAGDQLLLTASSSSFDPVLLLQKPGGGLATAAFDDSSGGGTTARLLVTADVAGTWVIAVTARDENAAGIYDLQIVRDVNAIVPTTLVEHDFTYDKAGNLVGSVEDQAAVATVGAFGKAASGLGSRTSVMVDALNRPTRYEQTDPAGGVVKRVDYGYRPDGSVSSVTRFAGAGVNPVATTTSTLDAVGRIVGISHAPAVGAAIAYAYAYDASDRVVSATTPEGTSSFTLDATDQLLSASLTGESYAYDATGNRTGGGTVTGGGNRLLFDGVYRYVYDAEGNRTARFRDGDSSGTLTVGDTDVTMYGWDQRNRLIAVSHVAGWTALQAGAVAAFNGSGAGLPGSDLELRFTYDYADRRIRRSLDADGLAGAGQASVSYAAYAGEDRTLEIARNGIVLQDGGGRVVAFTGSVAQRTLYGNGEDEVLAVDRVSGVAGGGVAGTFWTLADRQGTVRDIVSGNAATRGQVVEHRQYDSYGKLVRRVASPAAGSAATAGVGIEFGYAGRPVEERVGLSDNRARWYEPGTGRFVNEDPSGFKGGDANLFRYVGNDPLDRIDPSGLMAKWAQPIASMSVPPVGWAALGLTTSGVASQPQSASTTPSMSTYSLTGAGSQSQRPAASTAATPSQPFASLVTTGRVAPAVELNRWTVQDREAALWSDRAYMSSSGGMLKDLGVGYDARNASNHFTRSGMSATLARSPVTGVYYLAFRGTEISGSDLKADAVQGVGLRTDQYNQAIELTKRVQQQLGEDAKIILTGHSLGGGLAAAAAHATGLDATVFNPPSINRAYSQGTPGMIRSHVIEGDFLSVGRALVGRSAAGEIIVHPAKTSVPFLQHLMFNFPNYH